MEAPCSADDGIASAAIRASLSALSRVWKASGPAEFVLEQVDRLTVLSEGDLVVTVVFHLVETPLASPLHAAMERAETQRLARAEAAARHKGVRLEDALALISPGDDDEENSEEVDAGPDDMAPPLALNVEAVVSQPPAAVPPQLCVSYVVSVIGKQPADAGELLKFAEVDPSRPARACLEVLGSGGTGADGHVTWSVLNEDGLRGAGAVAALPGMRIVCASSFRHRFVGLDPFWRFDPQVVVRRCWLLTSLDAPFPMDLVQSNVDLLANFVLLGLVVPETLGPALAETVESQGLVRHAVGLETYEAKAKLRPLRLSKRDVTAAGGSTGLPLVGLLGSVVEASSVVGGAAFDVLVYDPNNLTRTARKRGKLEQAATAGAVIGGVVGVLIPIPGLFVAFGLAGSVAGRWIAGNFITEDGTELPDVIPVGGVRAENDAEAVVDVTQDFDEDAPVWKKTWNRLVKKDPSEKGPKVPPAGSLIEASPSPPGPAPTASVPVLTVARPQQEPDARGADKASSWPSNAWAQRATSWTNSLWSAIQQRAGGAAAGPVLVDVSSSGAPPRPPTSGGGGATLPEDLFAEPQRPLPPSETVLPTLAAVDEAPPPPGPDLLLFSFGAAAPTADAPMERVKSSDLLQFQL